MRIQLMNNNTFIDIDLDYSTSTSGLKLNTKMRCNFTLLYFFVIYMVRKSQISRSHYRQEYSAQ